MPMIVLAVTYVIRAGHEAEAENYLRELISASRQEPGCRAYDVNRSTDDPRVFLIYERYDDEAALEAHRATPHFERFGKNGIQKIAQSRLAASYVPLA